MAATSPELPTLQQVGTASSASGRGSAAWLQAARRAKLLSWVSLLWMTVEGVGGIWSGIVAGSLGLVAWGLTSTVEGLASAVVIWRFTGSRTHSATSERTAQKLVAYSLWLLTAYILVEAGRNLLGGSDAETSVFGIVLTGAAIVVMPLLGQAKKRLAGQLGSAATAGEGAQNIICALQSVAVLASMALVAISGSLSFVDPLAAVAIALLATHEGRETWRGKDCCSSPLELTADDRSCGDGCC